MLLLFPSLINFDNNDQIKKWRTSGDACHIFYSQRVMDIHDGLDKWSKHKGESEKMEESEPGPHGRD
jgi:hypothetical protein